MSFFVRNFILLISGLALLLPFSGPAYDRDAEGMGVDTVHYLSILFVGDVMQHQPQIDAAYDAESRIYGYDSCFKYVRDLVSSYDISIANLEVTLGGPPYTGYPQFSAPDNIAVALKNTGFDVLSTANNHSCDRGRRGIERTIRILDSLEIQHTGTFKNATERESNYPMIIKKNGIKVALLNYTYGTNGIAVPEQGMVNLIDTTLIAADLQRAKDSLVDKIIVSTHWGDEYQSHPNQWQEQIATFCFAKGADIVIGSHPHVVQKMERYHYPDSNGREVMLVYSLGNYISNQRARLKDGGASIGFVLKKKNGKTEIEWAGNYFTWVWVPVVNGRKQYYIVPVSQYETVEGFMDAESKASMNVFITDSRSLYGKENKKIGEFTYDINTKTWALPVDQKQ